MKKQIEQIKVESITIRRIMDEQPDLSEYGEERMDKYNYGGWYSMGIRAECVVSRRVGGGNRRLETFTSGGLWGIESDSGDDYLNEVAQDELDDLKEHLKAFGITLKLDELPELDETVNL